MQIIPNILKQRLCWVACVAIVLLTSLLLQYTHPLITQNIYTGSNNELLTQIAGTPEKKMNPVDYYVGEMSRLVFGPLSVFLAAVAFFIFALVFLKDASSRTFAGAVFVFLFISKFETLAFPPYGDAIGGPLAESIWLARNGFDYTALAEQPGYVLGGPKVYLYSIYPTLMAVLMKILPSAKVFITFNHLVAFALTAVSAAILRSILNRVFLPSVSIIATVLFLSTPISLSMIEAINMEVLVVFLALLSIYYLIHLKMFPAALFAVLATYTKGYGLIVCAAVGFCGLLLFFIDRKPKWKFKYLAVLAVVVAFTLLKVYLSFSLTFQHMPESYTKILSGWPSLKSMLNFYLFCVIGILYLKKLVMLLVTWCREGFDQDKEEHRRDFTLLVMFLGMFSWFAFFLNHMTVSPRYAFILMPFIIFCGVYGLWVVFRNERIVNAVLTAVMALCLVNSFGAFYPPIEGYNYVLQERSLEYRTDLRLTQRIANDTVEHYRRFHMAAPFIIGQVLAFPELGYVKEGFDITMYGWPIQYGGIKQFYGLKHMDISKTMWVGVKSSLPDHVPYPTTQEDVIVRRINVGREKAVFFIGGYAVERVYLRLERLKKLEYLQKKFQES